MILVSAVLVMQCGGELRESVTSPNVVFVTIDTLRADRLGAYGYFRDTTPVLDALASESLLFERCLAPMATTFPTHVSLITSTYPNETGALANTGSGGKRFRLTRDLRSLAQVLQENGYRTAAFVSATPLKKYSGLSAGSTSSTSPKARSGAPKRRMRPSSSGSRPAKTSAFFCGSTISILTRPIMRRLPSPPSIARSRDSIATSPSASSMTCATTGPSTVSAAGTMVK